MSKISDYLESALLNAVLRNTSYTSPAAVYIALYTSDPTDADSGTEVTGGSYARQTATFSASVGGAGISSNTASIVFPQATASWGTVTHVGLRDASSAGHLLFYGALTVSKTIGTGDRLTIGAGNLTVSPPVSGIWFDITPAGVSRDPNSPTDNYGFSTLVIDPTNPRVLYTGTNYQGLYKSTDGGDSWTKINTGTNGTVLDGGRLWTMTLDPFDHQTIYTTVGYGAGGVLKSTDGGINWQQMFGSGGLNNALAMTLQTNDIYGIAADPFLAGHLLASFHYYWYAGSDSGLIETFDGGTTWTIHNPPAGSSWSAGNSVWVLNNSSTWLFGTQGDGIWRTTDSGTTWTKVYATAIAHGGINALYQDPATSALVLAGSTEVVKSTDHGATWTAFGTGLPFLYYETVASDGTNLYTMSAFPSLTPGSYNSYVTPLSGTGAGTWSTYGSQLLIMGPFQFGYDSMRHLIYTANGIGGVFRIQL